MCFIVFQASTKQPHLPSKLIDKEILFACKKKRISDYDFINKLRKTALTFFGVFLLEISN